MLYWLDAGRMAVRIKRGMIMKAVVTILGAVGLAGAALAGPSTYDGAGRVVSPGAAAEQNGKGTVQAPPQRPQALLLPAVQKVRAADLEERRKRKEAASNRQKGLITVRKAGEKPL